MGAGGCHMPVTPAGRGSRSYLTWGKTNDWFHAALKWYHGPPMPQFSLKRLGFIIKLSGTSKCRDTDTSTTEH